MSKLLTDLIEALRCLPGVGNKSAQRMAFHLLERERERGLKLAAALEQAMQRIGRCTQCRNFSEDPLCALCASSSRDRQLLCVVESPTDLAAIEQATGFRGQYFVLMGRLSPLDGLGPEELGLAQLAQRLGEARDPSCQGLRDRRAARIQVRRRRLAARLTPVAAEKGWLLHVLPPEITVAVLACLDSSSMKSLRATSRQCHAIVGEHTTKLVLGAKGVQHFTTVPLHKVYPALAELSVGKGVQALSLLGLLQARGLERLDLNILDLSRCTTTWTVQTWREFVTCAPDGLHMKLNPRCLPNRHAMAHLRHGTGPNSSAYSSFGPLVTDARDVSDALLLLARLQPASLVELEGPDGSSVAISCGNQKGLDTLCRCRQLVKAALDMGPVASWTQWHFGCLKNLSNLTQLSMHSANPAVTLSLLHALKAMPRVTTLRLRGSVLDPACLTALSALTTLESLQVASIDLLAPLPTNPLAPAAPPLPCLPHLQRLVVTGTVQLPSDTPLAALAPSLQALSLFPPGVTLPFRLMQAAAPPAPSPSSSSHHSSSSGSCSSAKRCTPRLSPSLGQQRSICTQHARLRQHPNGGPSPHSQHGPTPPARHHTSYHSSPASLATLTELSVAAASAARHTTQIDPLTLPGLSRLLSDPLALQRLRRLRIWRVLDPGDLHKVLALGVSSAGPSLQETELHHCCIPAPPRPVLNSSGSLPRGTQVNGCGPFFRYTARQVLTNAQSIPRAMVTAAQMLNMTPDDAALQPAAALLAGIGSLTLVEGGGATVVKCLGLHALHAAMARVAESDAAAGFGRQQQQQQGMHSGFVQSSSSIEEGTSEEEGIDGDGSEEGESGQEDEESADGTESSASEQGSSDQESENVRVASSRMHATADVDGATAHQHVVMKLQSLRLVNVSGLTSGSLVLLMRHAPQLHSLALCNCPGVTLEWVMQARIDAGRRSLTVNFAGV
ncbi:MAG: hypothetical protein WDW36_000495 [Sanguina aurantia]